MNFRTWLLLVCLVSPAVRAQNANGPPFIAVHGSAKTEVVPDLFPLKLTLQDTSKDLAATQASIESLASKILEIAKSQGVAGDDVAVGNLSISPDTHYDDNTYKETYLGNEYQRDPPSAGQGAEVQHARNAPCSG